MRHTLRLIWLAAFLITGLQALGSGVSLAEVSAQKWLKVNVGELTIISDASESKVREWAAEMAWFRNGLRTALPLGGTGTAEPGTIFLFKSDGTMRRFLPEFEGKPRLLSGLFSSVAGHHVAMIGLGGSRFDVREKLFHEMTHWYLGSAGVDIPLWFHEGLAQVFETFTLQGDAFRIGHNQPERLLAVKIAGTPPLEAMLNQATLDFTQSGWRHGQTDLFYAQSWAVTHMLLFGAEGGSRERATHYIAALRQGLTGAEAFTQAFALTPAAARQRLDVYVRVPRWNFATLPLDRSVRGDSFQVSGLLPAELYQQFGTLLLGSERLDAAEPFIAYACATDGSSPRNWELAGLLALHRQPANRSAIDEPFEKARARGSQNPWVYALLGSRVLEDLSGGFGPVSMKEDRLREAGNLFLEALHLRPDLKPAVETLAAIVLESSNPRPEFRQAVTAGLVAAGGSPVVQLAVADGEIRSGKPADASRRLEKLLGQAGMPSEFAPKARELLAAAKAGSPGAE